MVKQQFLNRLQTALNGKLPSDLVMENIRYYEDYINTEIRKGKSEEEVLERLGDPRLIARTIVETSSGSSASYEEFSEGGSSRRYGSGEEYGVHAEKEGRVPGQFIRVPVWVWLVIFLIVVVLVLGVIFSVIAAVIRILLPVLVPILAVVFLVKLFRDWIN